MTKIWLGVFWGTPPSRTELPITSASNRRAMVGATGLAVAGTLAISLFAGTLFDLSERAANDLRDDSYITVVQR